MNPKKIRWTVVIILIAATLFDFITYSIHTKSQIFEINPLYIWTKSIIWVHLLKFVVVFAICFFLLKKPRTNIGQFFYVSVALYVIFSQTIGGISNLQVAEANPPPEAVMEESKAVRTSIVFSVLWIYFPLIMSLISFKLWELGYLRNGGD